MNYLLNYAHNGHYQSQRQQTISGLTTGGFDRVYSLGFNDLETEFREKHQKILQERRGAGYWIWKPYLILRTLKKLNDCDYLFYCDSAAYFIRDIEPFVRLLEHEQVDMLLCEHEDDERYRNGYWTKRDTFLGMGCDEEVYHSRCQILSGYVFLRKTDRTLQIIGEWLEWCFHYSLLNDEENQYGLPNLDGFIDHRHDQSILTNLAILHKVFTVKGIAQYRSPVDTIPQIVHNTHSRG